PPTPDGFEQALRAAEPTVRMATTRALNVGDMDTKTTLSVIKDLVRRMSAAPGQRTLVLVSPGFHIPSTYRQDEVETLDRAIRANVVISSLDARGLYAPTP